MRPFESGFEPPGRCRRPHSPGIGVRNGRWLRTVAPWRGRGCALCPAERSRTWDPRPLARGRAGEPGPSADTRRGILSTSGFRGSSLDRQADASLEQQPPDQAIVDFVIVAYRSARHIAPCLDLIANGRPEGSRVIVVDNHSPDESADLARRHAVNPLVITSPNNKGFGGACNLGAARSHADFLFFVNPDAQVARDTTSALMAAFRNSMSLGAIGPRIVDPAGDYTATSAGHEPSIRSILGHYFFLGRLPCVRRVFPPFQLPYGSPATSVDWVGGAALMVRREAFEQVSGFDDRLFMYMEDVDLCRRLRQAGWDVRYEPATSVLHEMGGSQGPDQPIRWWAAFYRYVCTNHGDAYARVCSAIAALGLYARAVAYARSRPRHSRRLRRAGWAAISLARGSEIGVRGLVG